MLAREESQPVREEQQKNGKTQPAKEASKQAGCQGKEGGNLPLLAAAVSQQNSTAGM